jgi:hypothetical protein
MEKHMNDLSEEVKAELANRVESKMMSFHIISLLKMMLNKSEKKESLGNHKSEIMQEHKDDAKEAVDEIIDLVFQTAVVSALHCSPSSSRSILTRSRNLLIDRRDTSPGVGRG